jgi:hypothetical protein
VSDRSELPLGHEFSPSGLFRRCGAPLKTHDGVSACDKSPEAHLSDDALVDLAGKEQTEQIELLREIALGIRELLKARPRWENPLPQPKPQSGVCPRCKKAHHWDIGCRREWIGRQK